VGTMFSTYKQMINNSVFKIYLVVS